MTSTSPMPFEKYHRRLVAGLFLSAPLFYMAFTFSPSNAINYYSQLKEFVSDQELSFIIGAPALAFSLYIFGFVFEKAVFGILVPAAAILNEYYYRIEARVNFYLKSPIASRSTMIFIVAALSIIGPLFILVASVHMYFFGCSNSSSTSTLDETLRRSNLGQLNEIEKLAHIKNMTEQERSFIFSKLEEAKTNLVYFTSIYSFLFIIIMTLSSNSANQPNYSASDSPLIFKYTAITIYISTLGALVFAIGRPQYHWIITCIKDFSEKNHAP